MEILVGAIEYVLMNNNPDKNELLRPMTNMQITYQEVAKGQVSSKTIWFV